MAEKSEYEPLPILRIKMPRAFVRPFGKHGNLFVAKAFAMLEILCPAGVCASEMRYTINRLAV